MSDGISIITPSFKGCGNRCPALQEIGLLDLHNLERPLVFLHVGDHREHDLEWRAVGCEHQGAQLQAQQGRRSSDMRIERQPSAGFSSLGWRR